MQTRETRFEDATSGNDTAALCGIDLESIPADFALCGIDLGSTTAKIAVLSPTKQSESRIQPDSGHTPEHPPRLLFGDYRRHNTSVREVLDDLLQSVVGVVGDRALRIRFTGSAALGLAEKLEMPFIQEVVGAANVVRRFHPEARAWIDIGGEDSKLVLFSPDGQLDMRMNGSCAGGTGAFIDQLISLLNIDAARVNDLASHSTKRLPIASRCGVFAKTDVANLLSSGAAKEDIVASVFHAVAMQCVNTLARGFRVESKVILSGGPLTFFPMLREMVLDAFGLSSGDAVELERPELISAIGAASLDDDRHVQMSAGQLIEVLRRLGNEDTQARRRSERDPALFSGPAEFKAWNEHRFFRVKRCDQLVSAVSAPSGVTVAGDDSSTVDDLRNTQLDGCFLGIDAGSTTTKMVLIDARGRLVLSHYAPNYGNHISAAREGLSSFSRQLKGLGVSARIDDAAVTGYGEDLLRSLLGLPHGVVETLAHARAAQQICPDVSFVLDIGGQDMKAMFIDHQIIRRIDINEACSSGCGSFLQTFCDSLGVSMETFVEEACKAERPCHLGSRCTVFMNSRVKQFLQEGASRGEIAAGLAYAVIRNCLSKVLKLHDMDSLGNKVVVQGGTFLNPAVQRAFELLTAREVICPDIAGLMGAYGCALVARDRFLCSSRPQEDRRPQRFLHRNVSSPVFPAVPRLSLESMQKVEVQQLDPVTCSGCGNRCTIHRLRSPHGTFHSGNRCERVFSSGGTVGRRGKNLVERKHKLLFDRSFVPEQRSRNAIRVGLPRALNLYENLPFWTTLLVDCGIEVVVSGESTRELFERGLSSVTSDNICMPAKLVHGHVLDLIDRKVDRILYPRVVYERREKCALNSYNCPIVTGYPDVIRSAINPAGEYGVPFDTPVLTFHDTRLLRRACWRYVRGLGVPLSRFGPAFGHALREQDRFSRALASEIDAVISTAERERRPVISYVGRPYHLDPLIHHGIPEKIAALGVDVIPGSHTHVDRLVDGVRVLTQWAYPNRLYQAVDRVTHHGNVEVLQANSFGCGPDAFATDELRAMLGDHGRDLTVLRVDENASPGSIRLRLRTKIETLSSRPANTPSPPPMPKLRHHVVPFLHRDRRRTILAPSFSAHLSPVIERELSALGYRVEVLPPSDRESLEYGLRYVNNEVCYPAILVIGDLLKALDSGRYKRSDVAVGITQTGGQCRASCYVNLLTKGLAQAGFEDIPAVALSFGRSKLHHQPGFKVNPVALGVRGAMSLIVTDALTMMQQALAVREVRKGESLALANVLTKRWLATPRRTSSAALKFLQQAVAAFARIRVSDHPYPKVGLVGEIYVKYGGYSNHHIVSWLTEQGVQVVVPPLFTFFFQSIRNRVQAEAEGIHRVNPLGWLLPAGELTVQRILDKANGVLEQLPHSTFFPDLRELAREASNVISLTSRFGEGWLLSGEMIHLAKAGAENILCLQPFGCIANQVVAKGIEKRLRQLHPSIHVLYIDLDHNTSETNMLNRVHFLVQNARDSLGHAIDRVTRAKDTPGQIIVPS